MDKEQTNLLGNLYSLRAGLSVISQECDKADYINKQVESGNETDIKSLYGALPSVMLELEYDRDIKNGSNDNVESYKSYCLNKIRAGELDVKRAESEKSYQQGEIYIYKRNLVIKSIILAVCITAIITFVALGISRFASGNSLYILFFVLAAVSLIVTIVWSCSASGIKYNISWIKRIRPNIKRLDTYIAKYKQFEANKINRTQAGNSQIAVIKRNSNSILVALQRQFSRYIDIRDWKYLDLVIFNLETRRADSIKEALQLVDREVQTQRIENAIRQATAEICNTLAIGFTLMQQTIENSYRALSAQISASTAAVSSQLANLTGAVNMNNALRAKANVSSQQLMSDVQALRNYIIK